MGNSESNQNARLWRELSVKQYEHEVVFWVDAEPQVRPILRWSFGSTSFPKIDIVYTYVTFKPKYYKAILYDRRNLLPGNNNIDNVV